MALHHSPRIVTDGLVLALDAGDRNSYVSGSTVWRDLTVNANNGTLTNGPTFNSTNGGNIVFDGIDDIVTVLNSPSIDTVSVSVELWVKWNSISLGVDKVLFAKGVASGAGNRSYWFYENEGVQFSYLSSFTSPISSNLLLDGKWHSITGTYDAVNFLNIYLDGNLYNSVSGVVTSQKTVFGIGINGYFNGTYHASSKNISSVKIYNRALSSTEILQNYNATKGRFGL
jgi:hypothetical protein